MKISLHELLVGEAAQSPIKHDYNYNLVATTMMQLTLLVTRIHNQMRLTTAPNNVPSDAIAVDKEENTLHNKYDDMENPVPTMSIDEQEDEAGAAVAPLAAKQCGQFVMKKYRFMRSTSMPPTSMPHYPDASSEAPVCFPESVKITDLDVPCYRQEQLAQMMSIAELETKFAVLESKVNATPKIVLDTATELVGQIGKNSEELIMKVQASAHQQMLVTVTALEAHLAKKIDDITRNMDDLNRPVSVPLIGANAFSKCVGLQTTLHDDTTYTHECDSDRAPATQCMYPHAHINSNHAVSENAPNAASIDRQPLDTRN
jgi:hypothetical protein